VHSAVISSPVLSGQLIRVTRPGPHQ
jgi:hypothetical protein